MSWSGRRLHFVGIGGAGMSGLALVARALGAEVTGSDRAESPYVDALRAEGVEPAIGHDAANVPDGAEVIVSTAIAADNPEVAGRPVLHRSDLLAEVARLRPCIAVTGTHGKTTTSCMVAHVLIATGHDPGYLIGGELRTTGRNAGWGDGDWIVVEADESDRSFLKLAPEVGVITNVELDHHATYRTPGEIAEAFAEFAAAAGRTIAWDAAGVDADVTYGAADAGDLVLDAAGARFTAFGAEVRLQVPGAHNVLNALAAILACREADVEPADAAAALESFSGARRRFERAGSTPSGAVVYDDYAHHPTEVRATLEAARTLDPRRLVACFQPHLYSRTERLAREFGRALALADAACVLDVYPARERAEDHPGVSGWMVATATADASGGRPVYWTPRHEDAERLLGSILGEGDVLLTLGAGDVDRVA
ncbi:MAG TPA: UDP-N-acetylmuramate--L-alanine ligase, partial [Thermoleophilaceae bacterium]|nr:UDP-N-acetylmuramate--L-alanine ligase [Thermoleophilaceae bacterium]